MSITGPRGKNNVFQVHIYDSATGKKRYVGQAKDRRHALALEEAAKAEEATSVGRQAWTIDRFAAHWLAVYHGPETRRPEPTTLTHNELALRRFRKTFGSRKLDDFSRAEAHEFAVKRRHEAKVVGAMFADAVDKHDVRVNPFYRLGLKQSKGRADIDPLTEDEVQQLADGARRARPGYGQQFAALITFAGWTGLRPGEICALEWSEVDLERGVVYVEWSMRKDGSRVRTKTKQNRVVVLAVPAADALRTVKALTRTPRHHVFATATGRTFKPGALNFYWAPVRDSFTASLGLDHWLTRRLRHDEKDFLDFYELRHHFGSMLADRGLSVRDIAAQMGNTPEICEGYIHDHRDRQHDRVRRALGESSVRGLKSAGETG